MKYTPNSLVYIIILIVSIHGYSRIESLDESWVCKIKRSCVDCLQLEHCSWCTSRNICFSDTKNTEEHFCNDTVRSKKYEMSLYENARCACEGNSMENKCRPEGVNEGPECHGRGTCVCGKCFCDPTPHPESPSMVIIGEYCEFDNFSCDGPKCTEGPYSINELHMYAEENDDVSVADPPLEE